MTPPDPVAALSDAVRADGPEALQTVLARHFPRVFAASSPLERVDVGDGAGAAPGAVLLRWPGAWPAGAREPVVLMAHADVVPVGDAAAWTHPPTAGVVAPSPEGEAVWGRGTLDDRGPLVAVCAAVEGLLAAGFVPARDVWLAFGADEETTGASARVAVAELRSRGVRPWLVLDEGGAVAAGALPGVRRPLAVVGVTEKGTTLLCLTSRPSGRRGGAGHASTPARRAPVARLARALVRLDAGRADGGLALPEPTRELLRRVAPHLPPGLGGVLRLLLGRAPGLVARALVAAGPESAAMVRTTLAPTVLTGSSAANVVPTEASALLDVRVVVGENVADVVARVERAVRGCGVEVEVVRAGEASPLSPFTGSGGDGPFALLERCIAGVFPDAVAVPYLMMAATDARFFADAEAGVSDHVYRFAPLRMSRAQRASIHGVDERVTTATLHEGVAFYEALLRGLPA